MSQSLTDFIDFFGLSDFFSSTLSVQQVLGLSITAFIGAVITIAGIRCIFELIKILTDWSRFK